MMFKLPTRHVQADVALSGTVTLNVNVNAVPAPSPSSGVWITIQYEQFEIKGRSPVMFTLPADKKVKVQVKYVDSKGNTARVDGDVQWESSDDEVASVGVLQGETTKAEVIPGDKLGQAQITATADADLGEGKQEIIATMNVIVVAGSAVTASIEPEGELEPIDDESGEIDNSLPGKPNRPDNTLPGGKPGIDNTLPGSGGRPDNTLPGTPAPKH
jgi:hypothetical protein